MKQQPARLKFRKNHKVGFSFFYLKDNKNFFPVFGIFALKSLEAGKLTFKQIEAGRKSIRRNVSKKAKIWIRVFTSKSVTCKPIAMRMGKGKGNHSYWMTPVRMGQIIYEVSNVSSYEGFKSLLRASYKMPFKTKVVSIVF